MNTIKERAFIAEINAHQRLVHKICKIYTDTPHDHEDLFQEIVIQLWKAYPNFRGDALFSTWAYKIALNTAMTLFRKKNRTPKINAQSDVFQLEIREEEKPEDSDKINAMYDTIHQLNDVEKALIMMFLDDKSYREIAEILGISEGNARIKMMRTREKLKHLIQKK